MNEFIKLVSDVCESPELLNATDDYRQTDLWGSLTAFALKVSLQNKYNVSVDLKTLASCKSVAELAKMIGVVE